MFKRLSVCLVSLVGVCAPLIAAPIFFVNDVSGFTSQAGVLSYDSFEYLSHSESSPIAFNGGSLHVSQILPGRVQTFLAQRIWLQKAPGEEMLI